jgi:hypothetical protein
MKGRARRLFDDFEASLKGAHQSFLLSRLILMARVIPEKLTPDTDDPALEARLEEAIRKIRDQQKGE